MNETEITETVETPVEEVRDPAAVLAKNRTLLLEMKAMKDRAAALEDLARDLGLDADALADPRAHIARRAEDRTASERRERLVKEATLRKLVESRRTPFEGVDALVGKVLADASVTVDGDGKVVGLEKAIERAEPKKVAPGFPVNPVRGFDPKTGTYRSYDPETGALRSATAGPAPESFEALVERGPEAIASYAREAPEGYAKLREDWQRRLANPGPRR